MELEVSRASETAPAPLSVLLACCCCCFFSPFSFAIGRAVWRTRLPLTCQRVSHDRDRLTVILANPHVSPIYFFPPDTLLPHCDSVPTRNYATRRFFLFPIVCTPLSSRRDVDPTNLSRSTNRHVLNYLRSNLLVSCHCVYKRTSSAIWRTTKIIDRSALFAFCFTSVLFVP